MQVRNLLFLVLTVAAVEDKTGWYRMKIDDKYLTIATDGRLVNADTNDQNPAYFKDFPQGEGVLIKIMTGRYANTYISTSGNLASETSINSPTGIIPKAVQWSGCRLQVKGPKEVVTYGRMPFGNPGFITYPASMAEYHACIIKEKVPCKATSILGSWVYLAMLAGGLQVQMIHGTNKVYEESRSQDWTNSVSAQASTSFGVKGIVDVSISLGYEFSTTASQAYRNEWSTNTQESWTVTTDPVDKGKALWQFQAVIKDDCNHQETTSFREYALTPALPYPPCCKPGFAMDAPYYTICTSKEALIEKTSKRCSVATSVRRSFWEKDSALFP